MATTFQRKISMLALACFTLASLGFAVPTQAALGDKKPKIVSVKNVTSTSAVLSIKFSELKKKDVVAEVRIRNRDTGEKERRTIKATLNADGKTNLKIDNLKAGTKYSFTVKIRKEAKKEFSRISSKKNARTMP